MTDADKTFYQGKRVLIVDDEEDICAIVQYHLHKEGYQTEVALSAEEALEKDLISFDLILLDVMMPGMSGFEMASLLKSREETAGISIIFLTAMDTDENIVEGLGLGADDYIAKPFSPSVLKARVEAVLRRTITKKETAESDRLIYEGIEINTREMTLKVDREEVQTTRRELDMLILLMNHPGRLFSREELLRRIWPDDVCVTPRTVDVNVARLRKKLGRYCESIHTRIGYGYLFKA